MKAILEFDLPEDADQHRMHLNAGKYHAIIWEYLSALRSKIKYGEEKGSFEEARNILWDLIREEDIDGEF